MKLCVVPSTERLLGKVNFLFSLFHRGKRYRIKRYRMRKLA